MAFLWRFVIAVLLAGWAADFIHLNVGIGVAHYVPFIEMMSYLTKPEEALGVAIIYYLLGDRLPARFWLWRGVWLGILILLCEGGLFRNLFMKKLLFPQASCRGRCGYPERIPMLYT